MVIKLVVFLQYKILNMKKGSIYIDRTGETHINNLGLSSTIIKYYSAINCTVQFNDGTIVEKLTYKCIKEGSIKNPNNPFVFGVGYMGQGKYPCTYKRIPTHCYSQWHSMIRRCYSDYFHKIQPTYKEVIVCEEWRNFQNFAKWHEENYNLEIMQNWSLDKDILLKDSKIYSPETCCFVPREINTLLISCNSRRGDLPIGVTVLGNRFRAIISINKTQVCLGSHSTIEEAFQAYKSAKEVYIKEIAEKWKDKIDLKVYQALINYQVEITD